MSTWTWILVGALIFGVLWFLWYSMSTTNRMSARHEIIKMTPNDMDSTYSSLKTVNGRRVPTGNWRTKISPELLSFYDRTGGVLR